MINSSIKLGTSKNLKNSFVDIEVPHQVPSFRVDRSGSSEPYEPNRLMWTEWTELDRHQLKNLNLDDLFCHFTPHLPFF